MRRHLVTLEMRQQSPDDSTGIDNIYVETGQAWAIIGGVMPGTAHIGDQQIEDDVTHRLILRWQDPTTFSHISTGGGAQRFRKVRVRDPDGRRMIMEVMCEEILPEIAE